MRRESKLQGIRHVEAPKALSNPKLWWYCLVVSWIQPQKAHRYVLHCWWWTLQTRARGCKSLLQPPWCIRHHPTVVRHREGCCTTDWCSQQFHPFRLHWEEEMVLSRSLQEGVLCRDPKWCHAQSNLGPKRPESGTTSRGTMPWELSESWKLWPNCKVSKGEFELLPWYIVTLCWLGILKLQCKPKRLRIQNLFPADVWPNEAPNDSKFVSNYPSKYPEAPNPSRSKLSINWSTVPYRPSWIWPGWPRPMFAGPSGWPGADRRLPHTRWFWEELFLIENEKKKTTCPSFTGKPSSNLPNPKMWGVKKTATKNVTLFLFEASWLLVGPEGVKTSRFPSRSIVGIYPGCVSFNIIEPWPLLLIDLFHFSSNIVQLGWFDWCNWFDWLMVWLADWTAYISLMPNNPRLGVARQACRLLHHEDLPRFFLPVVVISEWNHTSKVASEISKKLGENQTKVERHLSPKKKFIHQLQTK